MIEFFNEDIEFPKINNDKVINWIELIISNNGKEKGDITFIFCSDNYLIEINREYLNHDYNTDIITFNYNEENMVSGDIFISLETVTNNAKDYKVSFENELHRVIIHGVLHLIGFDDQTDEQQEEMTKKEEEFVRLGLKSICFGSKAFVEELADKFGFA